MNNEINRYGLLSWWLSEIATLDDLSEIQDAVNEQTLEILGFAANRSVPAVKQCLKSTFRHSWAFESGDLFLLLCCELEDARYSTTWAPSKIPSMMSSLEAFSKGVGLDDVQFFDPWIVPSIALASESPSQRRLMKSLGELSDLLRKELFRLMLDLSIDHDSVPEKLLDFMTNDKRFRAVVAGSIEPEAISYCHKLYLVALKDAADTPENRKAYLAWSEGRNLNKFGVEAFELRPRTEEAF